MENINRIYIFQNIKFSEDMSLFFWGGGIYFWDLFNSADGRSAYQFENEPQSQLVQQMVEQVRIRPHSQMDQLRLHPHC